MPPRCLSFAPLAALVLRIALVPPAFAAERPPGVVGIRVTPGQDGGTAVETVSLPGIRIGFVNPGLPAAEAGLREGDVLLAINGQPVTVDSLRPGQPIRREGEQVRLTVLREGLVYAVDLTVAPAARLPAPPALPALPAPANEPRPPAAPARVPVVEPAAGPGLVVGRVTMPDGSRITGDVRSITIALQGISEAGQRVQYVPPVAADGTYRVRVSPGEYRFSRSTITLRLDGREFVLPLEPVGDLAEQSRTAAAGIRQDFIWRPTGPVAAAQTLRVDRNDATQWRGMHLGLRWQSYRAGRGVTVAPPEGTRLRFTCRPLTRTIDGRTLEPFVVERVADPRGTLPERDLHDLPPADYEISGEAVLPDGSTRPLALQSPDEGPNFTRALRVRLAPARVIGGYQVINAGWVLD